jgi:hypothetical protein
MLLYGNAVVGQSGRPTAAINAPLAGVIRGVKENVHNGCIKTLYGMRNGVEGLLEERLVTLTNILQTMRLLQSLKIPLRRHSVLAVKSFLIPIPKRKRISHFTREYLRYSENMI